MTRSGSIAYRALKRAFDIVFSVLVLGACVLAWPITLLVLGLSAVQCKAGPFYAQERVGRRGRSFRLLKLRSMVRDADAVEKHLDADQLAQWERERKIDNDPRITPMGRIMRMTSLDEVPQFVNVLAGQMSVIGPRPIVADELSNFTASEREEILSVRPGITGWWQATERNGATWENGRRQALELEYVRNASMGMDAEVFARTFSIMFGKKKTGR